MQHSCCARCARCAVAYGVIAGLAAYIVIHFPFWLWDMLRAYCWPPKEEGAEGGRRRWVGHPQ